MSDKISVKFGFYFDDKNNVLTVNGNIKNYKKIKIKLLKLKPKIASVINGLESHRILQAGDLIVKLNKHKINNVYDFLKAKNKLNWNSTVKIQIKRNKKILDFELKIKSFENWKKKFPIIGISIKREKGKFIVSGIDILSSVLPEFLSTSSLKTGSELVSIDDKPIKKINDFKLSLGNCVPGKIINFKFFRDGNYMQTNIKIINFSEFVKLNRKFCKKHWPQAVSSFLVKKFEENDFHLNEKYKHKTLRPHWNTKKTLKTAFKGIRSGRLKLTGRGDKLDMKVIT